MAIQLGTAATQDSSAFASAAQGTKADSAVQQLQAGTGISIDATNPQKPIVTATTALTSDLPVSTHLGTAYSVANSAPVATLYGGLVQWWLPDVANAGPVTLNVDGTGDVPVYQAGAALNGNELQTTVPALVVYNNINLTWNLQAVPSSLFDIQYTVFTANGTFTPAVTGTYAIYAIGGGGGGGAGANVIATTAECGIGGTGGGAGVISFATQSLTAGTGYPVVIGTGGAASTGGNPTQFNSVTVAAGGQPGLNSTLRLNTATNSNGGPGSTGAGNGGGIGGLGSTGTSVGGNGGNGTANTGSGGGGGGGAKNGDSNAYAGGTGGTGGSGLLVIWRVA